MHTLMHGKPKNLLPSPIADEGIETQTNTPQFIANYCTRVFFMTLHNCDT